jgi:hypothetical protein
VLNAARWFSGLVLLLMLINVHSLLGSAIRLGGAV